MNWDFLKCEFGFGPLWNGVSSTVKGDLFQCEMGLVVIWNLIYFDNEMCSLLFKLWCKPVNTFRDNFHTWYGKEPPCRLCLCYQDSQEHALVCEVIRKELKQNEIELLNKSYYSQVYGNIEDQLNITRMYQLIISIRERLLASPQRQGLPGLHNSGPDWLNVFSLWK